MDTNKHEFYLTGMDRMNMIKISCLSSKSCLHKVNIRNIVYYKQAIELRNILTV